MNDKERLKILSDAIRKMASDAFDKSDAEEDQRKDWIEIWIDNYLCEDLLTDEKLDYLSDAAYGFLEGRRFDTLIVDPHDGL